MTALRSVDSKVKVLIVEDDCEMRGMLCDTIRMKYPFTEILCAENGVTGLDLFCEKSPDVVLSDINMSVMNGIQMAKEIRAVDPTAIIVFITAHSDICYLRDSIKIGVSRYLFKPIVNSELFETIDACFTQVSLQRRVRFKADHIRKLSRALEQSPIAVVITDNTGVIEYTNSKFTDMTGYTQDEVTGQNLFDQMTPGHLPDSSGTIWNSVNSGQKWHGEVFNQKRNGDSIWEDVDISHLASDDGIITHLIVIREDITELRHSRDEMLKIQKLESLGVLAGGIAHDFNNILTSIFGNIYMARIRLHETEKAINYLQVAENAIDRAKSLTQQLLTFARGGEPIKKVVSVGDLLKKAVEFALHGSIVSCEFNIKDDIWPVEADEGQLNQVIHNLVINAVQAMPEGGTITVSADNVSSQTDGKRFVNISVMDTGIGISEQDMQKIFDPYFTTKEQGKGLGLASCYSIIRKHGGKIQAISTLGKGSTFEISLPASEKELISEPFCQTGTSRGSGKILVMDDDKIIQEILLDMLEYFGYTAECVDNGTDAVELYRNRKEQGTPFYAVILDLSIPGGVGGKETIELLRKFDSNIKAIVSSGYYSDPVIANYRDYGFSAVLKKPYRAQDLSNVLNNINIDG